MGVIWGFVGVKTPLARRSPRVPAAAERERSFRAISDSAMLSAAALPLRGTSASRRKQQDPSAPAGPSSCCRAAWKEHSERVCLRTGIKSVPTRLSPSVHRHEPHSGHVAPVSQTAPVLSDTSSECSPENRKLLV